jgi:predicted membrane metal-binding protein
MNFLRLTPAILSLLVLGAHFLRSGQMLMVGACLALILLLLVRSRWVPRLIQVVLLLGSIEWLLTLYTFADQRMTYGQPWLRMAIILGCVALFTGASAFVFRNRQLKKYYNRAPDELL